MLGQPGQGDLQHDLTGPLRPPVFLLGVLKTFELAADVDKHACELRTYGHERPHHPLLGSKHLVTKRRWI
ncbi:MAG: hypothetical protein R3D30_06750 [Hyphomicrobiales bacterium]